MNKSGQSLGLALISIIFFFIIAFASINFIMDEVVVAQANLSCDATDLTGGNMFLCLITDITVLYFIGGVFAVVIGTIIARLLL